MKIVAGLGNPGPEYDATRHNVGWWVVDRLSSDWNFGRFEREGSALAAEGVRGGERIVLLKPLSYMNRSGPALLPWLREDGVDPSRDLLVVVDDAALDVGKVRFRPGGSDGGHKGLRSIIEVLGHGDFPRLRVGVGVRPGGVDMVEWVLSPMPEEDEDRVLALLPHLGEGIEHWISEGIESAMSRFNR